MASFTDFYFNSLMEAEEKTIEKENEKEYESEEEADEYALYTDPDIDYPEDELNERLSRKMVIRKGKKLRKWKSDREGYRVVKSKTGMPKEVRMTAAETRKRKLAQRKASKKRKSTQATSKVRRSISNRKRKSAGLK